MYCKDSNNRIWQITTEKDYYVVTGYYYSSYRRCWGWHYHNAMTLKDIREFLRYKKPVEEEEIPLYENKVKLLNLI